MMMTPKACYVFPLKLTNNTYAICFEVEYAFYFNECVFQALLWIRASHPLNLLQSFWRTNIFLAEVGIRGQFISVTITSINRLGYLTGERQGRR